MAATLLLPLTVGRTADPGQEKAKPLLSREEAGWVFGAMMAHPANLALALANTEQVQEELAVGDEQRTRLRGLREQALARVRQSLGNVREMSPDERSAKLAQLRQKAREEAVAVDKSLREVLTPKQLERLRQITLQFRGVTALGDKEVADALALTDDQKQKFKVLRDETRMRIHGAFREIRNARPEDRDAKISEIRKTIRNVEREASARAATVLSAQQRREYEAMKGAKFEVDALILRPRPGSPPPPKGGAK